MKASEFVRRFDAGEDVSGEVDWSKARRPNRQDLVRRGVVIASVARRSSGAAAQFWQSFASRLRPAGRRFAASRQSARLGRLRRRR